MSIFSGNTYHTYDPYFSDYRDPFYDHHHHGGATVVSHHTAWSNGGGITPTPFISSTIEWKETPEGHVLKAHLPGMKKEEVKVELEEGNIICITGEKMFEKLEENVVHFYRVERNTGRFVKRYQLPEKTKAEKMKAHMENGVLTIIVPRKEKKMIYNSKPIHIF